LGQGAGEQEYLKIKAMRDSEIGRVKVQGQPKQIVCNTSISKITREK
jgi:hypothetical protein